MAVVQIEPGQADWRKPRRSVGNGACVEVAAFEGSILVRDSKVSDSPVIGFPVDSWHAFLNETKIQ